MRKLLLALIGIFAAGFLSAQTYPYVDINQISYVDSLSLANCNDSSAYLGDTVVTRGIVVTDGNLSEVGSGSITGGSRPFITLVDTANNGTPGSFKGIVVMGALPNNTPVSVLENVIAGDIVEMTCIVTSYSGLIQLQPFDANLVSVVGFTTAPTFTTISAGDIQDQNGNNILPTGEQWEGSYVELQNMTVVSVSIFSSGSRCEFTVADSNGNQVLVADRFLPMVLDSIATVNPNSPDSFGSLVPPAIGTIYNHIRGVIFQDENGCAGGSTFAGGYEINPVYASDFDKAAPPPQVTNIQRNPLVPNASQSVTVSADIVDLDGSVTSATLYYSADQTASTSLFQSATMTNTGSLYSATIPAFPLDSVVRYYISATDDSSLTTNTSVDFYTVRTNGLTIMDIQRVPSFMSGDASPYDGDTVSVTGTVTASYSDLGYLYIQDSTSMEYSGVFVVGGPTSIFGLNLGDIVRIEGIVNEQYGLTNIQANNTSNGVTLLGTNGTINPVVLDPSDTTYFMSTTGTASVTSKATLEKYEGMLIRFENPATNGKLNIIEPDLGFSEYSVGSGISSTAQARVLTGRQDGTNAQSSLNVSVVSDSSYSAPNLNVPAIPTSTAQDMDALIGVLYYAHGNYKLTPRNNADFINFSQPLVGFESVYSNEVETKLYPNPAQDRVMIQLDESYDFNQLEVELIDLSGRVVVEHRTATHLSSINLSGLERGMYIVKVMNKGEMIHTAKMILK